MSERKTKYLVEFVDYGALTAAARLQSWEGDPLDSPADYLDEAEIRALREERECGTLDEAFVALKGYTHLYGDVKITRLKYCPGLYLYTDWEPQEVWTVDRTNIGSPRDLWRPKMKVAR